ncbi:uncharacterized protein LOC128236472 [Mya arenaria]|uniref:uncharacterized protein LOC128236472 n=1 Tax=Mya arenaria TaxID=6604 RepID=UPI0022E5C7FE|nr:uncharacterized protein LOC128236472 [Mya arenaria]
MWKFIKTYLSGTLDSFFEVVQELLRTREEFENLEMTVAVPDVIAAFLKSGEAQEIDPISMMCALELLSQRLNSLDEKQQDDSVRKSLELNLTNIQHDRENADIRTGKMEFDKSGVTSLKKKEQVLDEPKTLLEEFYLNKSGQQIMTTLKPEPSEKFFEEINFDEAGKKVKTSIQEEIEKPIEECTVEEAAKRVKTMIQEETEKPIEEYTVHDTGEKVKTTIQEETEKHIEEYTADEAGKTVKPTIQEETEKPIKKYTVHEAGEKVKKTIQEETEKHIEEYTIGEANEKVMASIFKETKMPIEGATIDESEQKVKDLAPVEPELSMAIFSTNVSEPKKELPTYYCEPYLQNEIKVQCVAKCRDCNEMLCADCARVHRVSKMSRNHIMIGKQPDDFTSLKLAPDTSIQPRSTSDHKVCKLSNMLPLPGNRLLLFDFNNGKFKMVDLRTNKLMSQVSVPDDPMGMCVLPGDRVAVCLPSTDITVIQFLGALEQITLEESIKVSGYCLGIGYYNDRLIVSFRGGKVEVIDMNGRVMKKIDSGQSVFRFPMNLRVVSEGQDAVVYVSDFQKDTITKLDMDLNILQTFQDPALRGPKDITTVGKQLLVCGWYTNNIMCLNLPSGKMTELLGIKDKILHPENVSYSQQQNRLYVKCQSDTRVLVYKPSIFFPGHMTNRLERRRRS